MIKVTRNIWIPYIIFLVLVGGLLVIFIYLSALVPNEVFSQKKIQIIFILILIAPLLTQNTGNYLSLRFWKQTPVKFRILFINNLVLIILCYLIVCLVIVMFSINFLKSPIKQKIYAITKNSSNY